MIDPATRWIKIAHIPEDDFTATRVSQLINQYWITTFPRPVHCVCDNGNKFKKDFKDFIKAFGIKYKLTNVKTLHANVIIECIHAVINDIIQTQDLDNHDFDPVDPLGNILAKIAWAICTLYHRTLDATPGQPVFGRDIIFDMLFTAEWNRIREEKRAQVLKHDQSGNSRREGR